MISNTVLKWRCFFALKHRFGVLGGFLLLLLFLPVLEGSFPDGGEQAARSRYD